MVGFFVIAQIIQKRSATPPPGLFPTPRENLAAPLALHAKTLCKHL